MTWPKRLAIAVGSILVVSLIVLTTIVIVEASSTAAKVPACFYEGKDPGPACD